MLAKFYNKFSKYLSPSKITESLTKLHIYDPDIWPKIFNNEDESKKCLGFCMLKDGSVFVDTRLPTYDEICGVLAHELIHSISAEPDYTTGMDIFKENYTGLNEILTEYINKKEFPNFYYKCLYDKGGSYFRTFEQYIPELTIDKIEELYFKHDPDSLIDIIQKKSNNVISREELIDAFNKVISRDEVEIKEGEEKLNIVIAELERIKQSKGGLKIFDR